MSGLSRERLEEIRARAEKATPGPWEFWTGGTFVSRYEEYATVICDTLLDAEMRGRLLKGHSENNGQFIAHSRTDVPDLLAEVDRLRGLWRVYRDAGRKGWERDWEAFAREALGEEASS